MSCSRSALLPSTLVPRINPQHFPHHSPLPPSPSPDVEKDREGSEGGSLGPDVEIRGRSESREGTQEMNDGEKARLEIEVDHEEHEDGEDEQDASFKKNGTSWKTRSKNNRRGLKEDDDDDDDEEGSDGENDFSPSDNHDDDLHSRSAKSMVLATGRMSMGSSQPPKEVDMVDLHRMDDDNDVDNNVNDENAGREMMFMDRDDDLDEDDSVQPLLPLSPSPSRQEERAQRPVREDWLMDALLEANSCCLYCGGRFCLPV